MTMGKSCFDSLASLQSHRECESCPRGAELQSEITFGREAISASAQPALTTRYAAGAREARCESAAALATVIGNEIRMTSHCSLRNGKAWIVGRMWITF